MEDDCFQLLLKTPKGEGAEIDVVVEKLRAVEKLFEAVFSSCVRPGAARASVPREIKPYTRARLIGAARTSSLGLDISPPHAPPPGYEGSYPELPDQGDRAFRRTVEAAAEREIQPLRVLYPEKADLHRVLRGLEDLSPQSGQPQVVLRGLNGSGDLIFTHRHGEWFEANLPSTEPEPVILTGMLKAGVLGANPKFHVNDGARSVVLIPEADQLSDLRGLFGKVVSVGGQAHYTPHGSIKRLEHLENIEPYVHRLSKVTSSEHEFELLHSLEFSVDASLGARGFALHNDELDIHAYGDTLKAAFAAIGEEFEFLWEEYALAEDDQLHRTGLELKRKLLALVKSRGGNDKVAGL